MRSSRCHRGRGRSHECRRDHTECSRPRLGRRDPCTASSGPTLPKVDQGEYGRGVLAALGRLSDWAGGPSLLRQSGFRTVALTLTADAVDLERIAAELGSTERVAILFGAEGGGLSAAWTRGAELRAKIPMTAGIDSLNVAAASAIACYVLGPLSAGTRGVTGQSPG